MQIVLELNGCGRETRILNIFRFWRLARLMNSIINIEKEAHNGTKILLENKNIELSKIEIENKRSRQSITLTYSLTHLITH